MLAKRKREEGDDIADTSRPAKAKQSTIPKELPNPHSKQFPPRHPWEDDFTNASNALRKKADWTTKVFNEEILGKWKAEIGADFTFFWDRLVEELQYLATLKTDVAEPSPVDGVWLTDGVIPSDLHENFVELVKTQLETQPKDYHPHSSGTVVDLVHPSLYCYVEGQTLLLPIEESNFSQLTSTDAWKAFLTAKASPETPQITLKESLAVIKVARTGKSSSEPKEEEKPEENDDIELDPKWLFHEHEEIEDPYDSTEEEPVENIKKKKLSTHLANIYRWLPAEVSISYGHEVSFRSYINGLHPFKHKDLYTAIGKIMSHFIPLWENVIIDLAQCDHPFSAERLLDESEDCGGISTEGLTEAFEENPEEPLMKSFTPPVRPIVDLSGSNLKVIVKIASIELTPEKPQYDGSWHVEGVPSEYIISTGIYYFGEENIKENSLEFQEALLDPENTDLQGPMGFYNGTEMNRTLGSVQTKQGRLLAFPNVLQHCVKDIKLEDPTKPGYRKFLVFFLIDPNREVISSAQVPPHREDWREDIPSDNRITLQQAKDDRENLMFTRKYYVIMLNEQVFERSFSFCEH